MIDHVAIVGAGFSGTLHAINLLRHDGPRATLIERSDVAGEGLAYGAAHPDHLLNVRAAGMSAFPDDADHFCRWLTARGIADPDATFVPRLTYRAYLAGLLAEARARAGDRLQLVRGDVVDLRRNGTGGRLTLADGRTIDADAAVLAIGNLPPHTPPGFDPDRLPRGRYKPDPWAADVAEGLQDDDTVLVLGTGLTMVDVVLMLDARGFGGRIVALSRRGLLPHRHAPAPNPDPRRDRPGTTASALLRDVRARGAAIGWRAAVDELRPFNQAMWRAADGAQRARFLRHLRPWWDIHRHRLAPAVADRIEGLRADGRLTLIAGKTIAADPIDGAVAVTWRPRGCATPETMRVARIVNCTGPQGDLSRTTDPLVARLVETGAIRPDAARLGIDVDPQARTIGRDGCANDWLYALGPMTRGAFWEIVAVPDLRVQTWTLARRLSHAQWVGWEGL
ncbi:FAD/NAD(P)-binding protein [uncultured Sphingomonas sp.]|uniref:FAD/NAD(P)-binding protein n=1 Tax=uncultured Sphingomonas sp. TaxID=158754 RepID=UPI0035CBFE8A